MAKARLNELYNKTIRPQLQKDLGLKNIMQVPRLEKIVLNIGVKEAVSDSRVLDKIEERLSALAGQSTVRTKARKSIAGFKIREGMPLGAMTTLRGEKMYEFLDRLINVALPNVRDFKGVTTKLDRRGNYNLGIKEWNIFPEADNTTGEKVYGLNISFHTSTNKDEEAFALLKSFNMPFRTKDK